MVSIEKLSSLPLEYGSKLYGHQDLLISWIMRTIRARYKQSLLGGVWAILQPLATVVIFTIIFTFVVPIDTQGIPYAVFSYCAMVPWIFLTTSITDMVDSLVANTNLVTKIYFPREVLPLAALVARLLDFSIASIILLLLMLYYQIPVFTVNWLYLPVILIVQLLLMLGIGFIGAALNVFYRDVRHIVVLTSQLWLYATPIIYPVTLVPERFRLVYFINPMAGIIESYRAVLIRDVAPTPYLLLSAGVAIITFCVGYWFFKQVEFQFADIV